MSILLTVIIGVWFGYQEIGSNFLGIHTRHMLSTISMAVLFFITLTAGLIFASTLSGNGPLTHEQSFIIMAAIAMTIALLTVFRQSTSAVTAMWGALLAIHNHTHTLSDFPTSAAIISLIVAPAIGTLLFILYDKLFEQKIHKADTHLLLKSLYMRRAAIVGIVLGCITFALNMLLLITPLTRFTTLWHSNIVLLPAGLITFGVIITAFVILAVNHGNSQVRQMSESLPQLYSMISVILLTNVAAIFAIGMPVIASPNQIKTSNCAIKGNRQHCVIGFLCITFATPVVAFLLTTAMLSLVKNNVLIAIMTTFVLIFCILMILYSRQWRKHNQTKKALRDELTHNSETGDERNKLDVAAVTSQFTVMTNEIDIKHKELVNLSLYIKQQRQYLDELSGQLDSLANEQDTTKLRNELHDVAQKLKENMRLTGEMDQFYTQVEQLHKNFVSRLQMRCPNLSEKEKRLAILLRLGLSSKDISSMMNVEPKSVEVSRYRFRRKLKIDRNVNIVQYLQMI